SPTLGAWGIGWQVMLDGLEITQFTYFQQCGGVDLFPISAELTYGLERIAAFLQDVDSIYDIVWARDPETGHETKYGEVRLADELQMSVYNFEMADVATAWKHFELCEAECNALLDQYARVDKTENSHFSQNPGEVGHSVHEKRRFPLLGTYELCLKCSHLFNILDARGAISVTERVGVIARVTAGRRNNKRIRASATAGGARSWNSSGEARSKGTGQWSRRKSGVQGWSAGSCGPRICEKGWN